MRLRLSLAALFHAIRFAITAIAVVLCAGFGLAQDSASATLPGWKLVWHDEFDGKKLDYSKWEAEVNAFGGGNNELQMFTDRKENVRVEEGTLVIEAHKEQIGIQGTTRDYSSARVRTKHRGDWKYGRFDIKAKLPKGRGVWPAIWMLPTEDTYGGWAKSGEIDIVEVKGQEPNRLWTTLHYGDAWPKNQSGGGQYVLPKSDFAADFHLFTLEWEEREMRWLVDNQLVYKRSEWNSVSAPYPAPFDQPFHLILNVSVGGGFVGNPDASAAFPQKMLIDFVRVYEKSDR